MWRKLQSVSVPFAISMLSLVMSIACIILNIQYNRCGNWQCISPKSPLPPKISITDNVLVHICVQQITGGVLLIVGVIKRNHWLLIPWLLGAVFFVYAALFYSFNSLLNGPLENAFNATFLIIVAAFWIYYAQAVVREIDEMRQSISSSVWLRTM